MRKRENSLNGKAVRRRMQGPAALFDHHRCFRLLPRCTSPATVLQAHAQLITTGLILHTYPLSRFLLLLASLSKPSYAISLLRKSPRRSTFLYNTLISAFSGTSPLSSWSLYFELAFSLSLRPNSHSYPSLLRLCVSPNLGLPLHAHILKFVGSSPDPFVETALLSFYCRCGRIDLARHLFDRIPQPDLPTWNSILSAYAAHHETAEEAFSLFRSMQLSLTKPNEITMVALISACASLGALAHGTWLHAYIIRDLKLNRIISTALITMYGRSGKLAMAEQVFSKIKTKDTAAYNAMIQTLAIHGKAEQALTLFESMGSATDEVTFVAAMAACAHAGLVAEGRRCFAAIAEPSMEHWCCLVDLLGRAGMVEEAEEAVRKMKIRPSAAVYRALLAACGGGEDAARGLLQIEPKYSGNYVLLANLYASKGRWEEVGRVRKTMGEEGVKKEAGKSHVEIDGEVHVFLKGDTRHPMWREIFDVVEGMRRILEGEGGSLNPY